MNSRSRERKKKYLELEKTKVGSLMISDRIMEGLVIYTEKEIIFEGQYHFYVIISIEMT